MRPGKAQFIQFEQSKVRLRAHCNFANVAPSQTGGGPLGRPTQRISMRNPASGGIAESVDHQRMAHFLD